MEIRILTMDEIPQAVSVARGVFDYCLRRTMQFPQYISSFQEYADVVNVRTMMEQGRLTLWGAYEMGHLVAMSGMQSEGHITMLYVLPVYQRRGYGRELLRAMRVYAGTEKNLDAVTVNAMPVWTASYFQKRKFTMVAPVQPSMPFASLQAKSIREVSYEKKPLSAGWVVGTVFAGLGICTFAAVAFMVSYFL